MKTTKDAKRPYSQEEIDHIVVAQADDDSAWEPPIVVQPTSPTSIFLPAEIAARAAFIARLHQTTSVEEWLVHIIQERLDMEESIYGEVKRDLIPKFAKQQRKHRLKTTPVS